MAGSFSFDSIDLSTLGIRLVYGTLRPVLPGTREREVEIPGRHGAYSFPAEYLPRRFLLRCSIIQASRADLLSNLEALAALIDATRGSKQLIFDDQPDRYFLAKYSGDLQLILEPFTSEFNLPFVCADPFAYNVVLDENPHNIETNPDTIVEDVGGTVFVKPVWKLTPNAEVNGTVKLSNDTTGEEIQWTGQLNGSGDFLEIDAEKWLVKKNTTVSMESVIGAFPTLQADSDNSITVTGMTGTLLIAYRDRYL